MRGESARPGKRPLRALSASEKMEAIQRVHEGESKASVARDIGVPESTLRGWCKSEHKIRGMARNSSTPDSEAHSPGSSSGANPLVANLSSEDEGGPSCAKKMKLESFEQGESNEAKLEAKQQQPKIDYVSSIINSLVANGVHSESSSILLHQLGLLSSAQSAASLTKNLLNLSTGGLTTSHMGGAGAQAVGLVENGLQYSKSSVGGANHQSSAGKRHSASSSHMTSAIAPTSQLDSVSKARKSLPPAAEAPSTPVPASPRKTNDHHNGSAMGMNLTAGATAAAAASTSRSASRRDNGTSASSANSARKSDESLWIWLAQQQHLLGQPATVPFNPSPNGTDGSWFWQWYKQCSYPAVSSSSVGGAQPHATHLSTRRSPSKAKAVLDSVLCNYNNNNENVRRSLNVGFGYGTTEDDAMATGESGDDVPLATCEEAIEHGDKFFKWLTRCGKPTVTQLQIMQFKFLLDNLKGFGRKRTGFKKSRK